MSVLQDVPWVCEYCGESNTAQVDFSGLHHQEMTEDCSVCCRPNLLKIDIDYDRQEADVRALPENA